jgi:hypothetical protein
MNERGNGDETTDPIATLIRLAGRRPAVNEERVHRVRSTVRDEWRRQVAQRRRIRIGASMISTLAIAATVGGVLLFRAEPEATQPWPRAIPPVIARVDSVHGLSGLAFGDELRAGAVVRLGPDASASLSWNGATLRVDANTSLRLDAANVATLDSGAIYYASDAKTGVVVQTPFGDVRDIGTRFEVRATRDTVRVRVRDGAVLVRGTTARAGTEFLVSRNDLVQRAVATSGDEWGWIERAAPPVILDGRTLEEVVRTIAEEKGLRVEWQEVRRRDVRFHGTVPLSATEALDAAAAASGTTYRIVGDRLIVGSGS